MKRIPLALQLFLSLLLIVVVPSLLLILYSSHVITQSSYEKIAEASLDSLEATRRLNEAVCDNISSSIHRLAATYEFSELANVKRYDYIRNNYQSGIRVGRLQQELSTLARNNSKILSAFFVLEDSDYVISSDRGVAGLDSYPNLSWLRDVKSTGVAGVWVARRLSTATPRGMQTGTALDRNINVISYIYSLNHLTTSVNGTLVVNVRERDFFENLNTNPTAGRYGTMLLDADYKIISYPDASNFLTQAQNLVGVSDILDVNADTGYTFLEIGGQQLLYTYLKTPYHGWVYITIDPMERMAESTKAVTLDVALFISLIVLVCAAVAVVVITHILRPMRSLMKQLQQHNGLQEVSSKNEMLFLYHAFEKIQSQEKFLTELLQRHEKDVLVLALHNLIAGEPLRDDTEHMLKDIYPHPLFLVAIIVVDNHAQYRKDTNPELRNYHRMLLITRSQEIFSPVWPTHGIDQFDERIALIINFPHAKHGAPTSQPLERLLQEVRQAAQQIVGSTVTVGVGRVVAGFDGISFGAISAEEAIAQRIKTGGNRVVYWKKEQTGYKFYYPQHAEGRIINYLDINDFALLQAELDALRSSLMQDEEISYANIRYIYSQLVGATIRHLSENNLNTTYLFSNRGNIYAAITSLDTLDEIQHYLEEFYREIIERQTKEVPQEKQHLSRIFSYIKAHYQEEIDFEDMAQSIGISYSHMRKIVRDASGSSLLEHMNRQRIQQAKSLLLESDMSIAAIATEVGYRNVQSLNRFFNKYEGLPPSEYRALEQR